MATFAIHSIQSTSKKVGIGSDVQINQTMTQSNVIVKTLHSPPILAGQDKQEKTIHTADQGREGSLNNSCSSV